MAQKDFDWRKLANFAVLLTIAMLLWGWWPAIQCVGKKADDSQIPTNEITDDSYDQRGDMRVVGEARGFAGGFVSGAKNCFARNPVDPTSIQRKGAIGGFFLWLFAFIVGKFAKSHRIKRSAQKHKTARRQTDRNRQQQRQRRDRPSQDIDVPNQRRSRKTTDDFDDDPDPTDFDF